MTVYGLTDDRQTGVFQNITKASYPDIYMYVGCVRIMIFFAWEFFLNTSTESMPLFSSKIGTVGAFFTTILGINFVLGFCLDGFVNIDISIATYHRILVQTL